MFFTKSSVLEATCYMGVKIGLNEDLFKPKQSKSNAATNLHAIPQNLLCAEGARDGPIWTVILQMLFQIFPLEFLPAILRAQHINKITLLQVILKKRKAMSQTLNFSQHESAQTLS